MAAQQSGMERSWYERVPLELHGHRKKLDCFLRFLELFRLESGLEKSAIRILEIGCSNGKNLTLPLAERGFHVTGVDLHEPSIAWASSHNEFSNARFICQDAESFVTQESFHVVILSDVLEHVMEPFQLLLLAKCLLRDKGMVLICVPNGYGPAELERRFLEKTGIDFLLKLVKKRINQIRRKEGISYNEESGHVQYFRMGLLKALIADAGFVVDECCKGALLGGGITYPLGSFSPFVVKASLLIADYIPFTFVSTWYFRCSLCES